MQAGGDQGRDFESYRTFLAGSTIGTSTFATRASQGVLVGACSLQKSIIEKIKGDLATIFGAGTRPNHVVYFCEADIPVAKRHEILALCQQQYGATLEIFDGQAIADMLADRDTFWIAEQFLSVPADKWPEETTDERYRSLRDRWIVQGDRPQNFSDFLDIKEGLRAATFEDGAKPDLTSWLRQMGEFLADGLSDRLVQKARYEISVAELRGRGSLDPARDIMTNYFANLSVESAASELRDAAVLSVYAWGALGHQQTSIPTKTIESWSDRIRTILETALENAKRIVDRCVLLEAKAVLSPVSFVQQLDAPEFANRFFAAWGALVQQIKQTPYYPVEQVARVLEQATPIIGADPRFRALADDVDLLVAERTGAGAAADLARRRAVAHLKAERYIAAINELQRAKIGWFSGESMEGSILSMLVISESLSELNLQFAARYYAAGALFLILNHEGEDLKRKLGPAYFRLAETYHATGEGISYLYSLSEALDAHHAVARDPHDWTKHPHVQASFAQATILRSIARHLDPALVPLIDQAISNWPLPESEKKAFISLSERPPWSEMSREEVESKVAEELGVHPFSDVGPRAATWSALGIVWTVTATPSPEHWLAVCEIAAILQLAQVEFADTDLVVIPSNATIEVEISAVQRPKVQQLPDNGRLAWRVIMPAEYAHDQVDDQSFELAAIAITILGQATALPFSRFKELTEERFARGMSARFFSVRPIRELLAFAQPAGIPWTALSNTARQPIQAYLAPIEARELSWPVLPGPGYSRERAEEFLRNRYEVSQRSIEVTLPSLLADPRCRELIQELRVEGFLDWQILGIISSIVTQFQVEAASRGMDVRLLEAAMKDRIYRAEQASDPKFELGEFTRDRVFFQKKIVAVAALRAWGLEVHRQTPDFDGVKKLLDLRYGHSTDDLPHDDPFGLSKTNDGH
ncbi:hypothetical protein [Bradyrhizobium sp. USDA 336]|uniref:hypothetical protein n=1 Tax=Bradyrhizobium sp. USDA 336 TaxID=3156311 RepID=UPI00384EAF7F